MLSQSYFKPEGSLCENMNQDQVEWQGLRVCYYSHCF